MSGQRCMLLLPCDGVHCCSVPAAATQPYGLSNAHCRHAFRDCMQEECARLVHTRDLLLLLRSSSSSGVHCAGKMPAVLLVQNQQQCVLA